MKITCRRFFIFVQNRQESNHFGRIEKTENPAYHKGGIPYGKIPFIRIR